ncbi:RICIN domain-containing protein [Glycomyces sp. A-F 0318]|uniref:RICIN domain-containing protein n=1 Tax=Glycomyces amatae TaxID=2881355 RepID=UPI001E4B160A|nr:RICIN domain-containing protein [Glycomyces amatae]MCD0446329.1 RICIN domain-containing protein [Glycomyces amatae]
MPAKFEAGARPSVNVKFKLGFVEIDVPNIAGYAALRKDAPIAGPFLLIERSHGLALETDARAQPFWKPWLATVHGGLGQQWGFRRPKLKVEEFTILSAVNGMALDATVEADNGSPLVLWESHGGPCQRWEVLPVPDGIGWMIATVHGDRRVLDVGEAAAPGQNLWMYDRRGMAHQQFLIVPVGRAPQ